MRTASSPSLTQEMETPNLYLLGSPSLNCHLLCFTQHWFWLSPSLPREHIFDALPSPLGGIIQQSLPGQMLLVEALIALGRS